MAAEKKYTSFWSFYPYYLTEHGEIGRASCRERVWR